MTDHQLKKEIEKYRVWADYISKLRYFILSKTFPKKITFTNNGTSVKYEYPQEVEDILEVINKMEESVFKEMKLWD